MTQSHQKQPVQKITLSSSRDIPFDKLVLSQSNVRHIKAGVSIEELAEDIARRTLIQSIMVRPVRDADGAETGMYEIPAGGRRYRALALLVKQRRLAKTAPVPCVVREDGTPEEDSLAENVQRAPLHPLDQFRAFLALREKGQSEEEIAAAQFVPVAVVKQRLRLRVFYRYAQETCLELDLKSVGFSAQAPGLADSALAVAYDARHAEWAQALPKEPVDLWDLLAGFEGEMRQALFAHCVSLSVNAIYEPYNRRPKAIAHADRLATAVDLDMVAAGWVPMIDTYFGRVTKARIMDAVRETKGDAAATRIAQMKKPEMAAEAQALLAGSGWLPEPLRTPGRTLFAAASGGAETVTVGDEPAAFDGARFVDDVSDHDRIEDGQADYHAIAA